MLSRVHGLDNGAASGRRENARVWRYVRLAAFTSEEKGANSKGKINLLMGSGILENDEVCDKKLRHQYDEIPLKFDHICDPGITLTIFNIT